MDNRPALQLRTNRSLIKFILLSIITFGIYGLVVMSHISEEINTVASSHDGKHTMHYLLATLLLGPVTLGIYTLVWSHQICNRIGNELRRRNIPYEFSASTFWLWGIIGGIIVVGPFVFAHKMLTAMNALNADYNVKG